MIAVPIRCSEWAFIILMMHIVIITSSAKALFNLRKELVESWVKAGFKVTAIGDKPESEFGELCQNHGFDYKSVNLRRNGLNPIRDIGTLLELTALLKKLNPDRVFCTFAKSIAYGAWAAKKAGISQVYSLMSGLGSIYRNDSFKTKIIRIFMNRLYRNAFTCSRKVIFQNNDDRELFIKLGLVQPNKTEIVNGSGVDLNRYEFSILPNNATFLFVGRLLKEKGIREYINAAGKIKTKYPNARFLAVGDIDTNPSSLRKEEIEKYQAEGLIAFEGFHQDVRPFIRASDYFVLPSYHEGTPRCVLEAMAMGRPIITTDAPGCRETVINGINGFLVPIGNIDALAEKMDFMLNHKNSAIEMGRKSRCIVEEKYDVEKVNQDYFKIMEL